MNNLNALFDILRCPKEERIIFQSKHFLSLTHVGLSLTHNLIPIIYVAIKNTRAKNGSRRHHQMHPPKTNEARTQKPEIDVFRPIFSRSEGFGRGQKVIKDLFFITANGGRKHTRNWPFPRAT